MRRLQALARTHGRGSTAAAGLVPLALRMNA
jgi:hypothetical protein